MTGWVEQPQVLPSVARKSQDDAMATRLPLLPAFLLLGCAEPAVLRAPLAFPEMEAPPPGGPLPAVAQPTGGRIELPERGAAEPPELRLLGP